MEHGDLALTVRPRYVLVLEGVLADVTPITQSRRLRRDRQVGYNIHWYDLPLRRLATMKRQFPDVGAEIITFISEEVIDIASDFLDVTSIPYDSLSYADFHSWISMLPFQDGLQAVFDSDEQRLSQYGQIGKAVMAGRDFN